MGYAECHQECQPGTDNTEHSYQHNNARRNFLKLSALGAAVLGSTGLAFSQQALASSAKKPAIGLQLYTVRDLMAQNVASTLQLVAAVGYTELEFAGYFNQSPAELKKILDGEGLSAPSCHVPLEALQSNIEQVIAQANILGHKYVVLPYLTTEQRGTDISRYQQLAEQLNKFGEQCRAAGLQMAYHNHDFEFQPLAGQVPYEVLLQETDATLVKMELDLYWTEKAGLDPLQLFAKHPGRFPLWHVKDMGKAGELADVGAGTIDFKSIFEKAQLAGLQHHFIEHDESNNKILTIRRGFETVNALLQQRSKAG